MGRSWTVEVNIPTNMTQKAIDNLLNESFKIEVGNTLAKTIDPWVPFLSGTLSQTVEVTDKDIRYKQPYAHYQYEGINFNHTTQYHPLASARWDQVALNVKGEEFIKQVQAIFDRRMKNG